VESFTEGVFGLAKWAAWGVVDEEVVAGDVDGFGDPDRADLRATVGRRGPGEAFERNHYRSIYPRALMVVHVSRRLRVGR
jgi:hypothetical protein